MVSGTPVKPQCFRVQLVHADTGDIKHTDLFASSAIDAQREASGDGWVAQSAIPTPAAVLRPSRDKWIVRVVLALVCIGTVVYYGFSWKRVSQASQAQAQALRAPKWSSNYDEIRDYTSHQVDIPLWARHAKKYAETGTTTHMDLIVSHEGRIPPPRPLSASWYVQSDTLYFLIDGKQRTADLDRSPIGREWRAEFWPEHLRAIANAKKVQIAVGSGETCTLTEEDKAMLARLADLMDPKSREKP